MTAYEFSSEWFSDECMTAWSHLVGKACNSPIRALEIGSYEGRSAIYIARVILRHPASRLVCVDPWCASTELPTVNMEDVFSRFLANVKDEPKITHRRQTSRDALVTMIAAGERFDMIYIDGAHSAHAVLQDSVFAWEVLRDGGIVIWDDYSWEPPTDRRADDRPGVAIDAFLQCLGQTRYKQFLRGGQVGVIKLA